MPRSSLESKFLSLWKSLAGNSPQPETEYRFHPTRRWRFDFAFPESKVAVEMEGGVWTGGGHNRGTIYNTNCDKYNEAALLGWIVLRYTTNHLRQSPVQIIEQVKRAIESQGVHHE